jgi:hypothetical protein
MNAFFHIFIFILILFFYMHIVHQYKKSEDMEIYEMDYVSNSQLHDVCNIKQPVLFQYRDINPSFFEELDHEHLDILESHDVKIKDIRDYYNENQNDSVDYTVMTYRSAETLMNSDTKSSYFTENNFNIVDDAGLLKTFKNNDTYFKPPLTVVSKYDILTGSKEVHTPLRYHINERYMLCVMTGKITVKMTPWKSCKYLYPNKDYDMFEFWSPVNVWKPQRKYFNEMDKMKCLEFDVNAGHVLCIPPYWWYSIKYDKNPETVLTSFTYNTAMNYIANIPDTSLYFMQQQNIKTRVSKTISKIDNNDEQLDKVEEIVSTI